MQRIDVLGVPVDILQPQDMEKQVMELISRPGTKQVIFLSVWDLLRARGKSDYAQCVREADLVLPVSKSILRGARFLKKNVPCRYKSLYMLGGRKKTLMAAESNVRRTFSGLRIVGRYVGYYPKSVEGDVVEAIRKASPSLVLVSEGIREKDCWAYNRREKFSGSIFLYYRDVIGIFSERIKRVSEDVFNKGLEIWHEILHNPLKIFLLFPYIWYIILLVWYRIFKKS